MRLAPLLALLLTLPAVAALAAEANDAPDPVALTLPAGTFIQPGQQVRTPLGSCTLNFAYDGTGDDAGRVFIGTAAHCFSAVGEPASVGGVPVGQVVYLGDVRGGDNGIPGVQTDFALIEVLPAYHASVKGEVKGHPGLPTGLKPWGTARTGDLLYFSGYGTGFSATQPTREARVGVYTVRDNVDGRPANWAGIAPIIFGDSGGPVLHADGRALGVISYTQVVFAPDRVQTTGMGGAWVQVALSEAAAQGFTATLRTA